MLRATIGADGRLTLGDEAEAAGFGPGVVVDVLVTSAGTLILDRVDHEGVDGLRSRVMRLPAGQLKTHERRKLRKRRTA